VTNTTHSGAAESSSERGSREKDDIPGGAEVSSDDKMLRSSRLPIFMAGVPWQRVGRQGSDRTTKERERERVDSGAAESSSERGSREKGIPGLLQDVDS
jgi:hypothetical protein